MKCSSKLGFELVKKDPLLTYLKQEPEKKSNGKTTNKERGERQRRERTTHYTINSYKLVPNYYRVKGRPIPIRIMGGLD